MRCRRRPPGPWRAVLPSPTRTISPAGCGRSRGAVPSIVILGLVPRVQTGGRPQALPRPTDVGHAGPTEGAPAAWPASAGATAAGRASASTGAPAQPPPYARASVPGPAGGEAFVA